MAKNLLGALVFGLVGALIGFAGVRAASRPPTPCPVDICVALTPQGMNPDELAISAGTTVQFNAADGRAHNLAAGKGADHHDHGHDHQGGFLSGEFDAGEAWRVQFKETGTYRLHDHLNPEQTILVVVY